ncbi:MAG: MBL fold metallo-hydrolase [Promethearchaeota archaeon]|nr:MAG: MBL fold metallo-hydrolase [Candidatus Lokiarchaeota archaeon]
MINESRVASGIAVVVDNDFFLIDVGSGTYRNAELLGLPVSELSKIFITHFHSDHIGDLGEANIMSWANGRRKKICVYGPEGVDQVINGFNMAYNFDKGYRIAHHGEKTLKPDAGNLESKTISIQNKTDLTLVFESENLKIFAVLVDHSPIEPALGFRIEYKGKTIAITGDTKKTDTLPKLCKNADILFADAISYELLNRIRQVSLEKGQERNAKILNDIQNYHMNPIDAAHLAKEANVKKLVYVHITPQLPNKIAEKIYLNGVSDIFNGEILLGEDKMDFLLTPE